MINLRILDKYIVQQKQGGVFLVALTQTFPDLILLLLPKSMQHFFYTTTKKYQSHQAAVYYCLVVVFWSPLSRLAHS